MFATAAGLRIPVQLVMGFVDNDVNQLLDLDTKREVTLSLVPLGTNSSVADSSQPLRPLNYQVAPYSQSEVDYPLMRQAHEASSLEAPDEAKQWRSGSFISEEPAATGELVELKTLFQPNLPGGTVEEVILKRGSSRQFTRLPIPFEKFSRLLVGATRGIWADFLKAFGTRINDLYMIINAVEDISPGAYYLRRDRACLELLKKGSFRQEAGHLGLDQDLPADASVAIFFLADLKRTLGTFGNRGYRAAQIEAGIIGGKIYLGAYEQGLGATGLTFYDDEVAEFFSPHAKGKSAIFLTAVGLGFKSGLRVL
jgi:SagB-type dehydrogenase family enzyme